MFSARNGAPLRASPPKLDAILKANDPKLYVPLLCVVCAVLVAIIYRNRRRG